MVDATTILKNAAGVSVAGIAMANDINPNQLQRWIRECRADGGRAAHPLKTHIG